MEESWTWWCAPVILAMVGSVKYEGLGPSWSGQKVRPYLQNNESREAGGMAQAIKCLPSKHEGWNSNSRTTKKKKKETHVYDANLHLPSSECVEGFPLFVVVKLPPDHLTLVWIVLSHLFQK
jgi:hypothetical protein